MRTQTVIRQARQQARMTTAELAHAAGTSRPTVSAYENGRLHPQSSTLERLLDAAGHDLSAEPRVTYQTLLDRAGRPFTVPDRLPSLTPAQALRTVVLPVTLDWSSTRKGEPLDLRDWRDRRHAYERVLREGTADDIASIVDGALLVTMWEDLRIPSHIRTAWQRVIDAELAGK